MGKNLQPYTGCLEIIPREEKAQKVFIIHKRYGVFYRAVSCYQSLGKLK